MGLLLTPAFWLHRHARTRPLSLALLHGDVRLNFGQISRNVHRQTGLGTARFREAPRLREALRIYRLLAGAPPAPDPLSRPLRTSAPGPAKVAWNEPLTAIRTSSTMGRPRTVWLTAGILTTSTGGTAPPHNLRIVLVGGDRLDPRLARKALDSG